MFEKIRSEVISRRKAFSLLGLPVALGFAAAPMLPMPSDANAHRRPRPRRGDVGLLWLCRAADRTALSRGACLINS